MNKKKYILFSLLVIIVLSFLNSCDFLEEYETLDPLPKKTKSYDFVVLGDNRPNIQILEEFMVGINSLDVNEFFHLGDMIEFSSPLGFISVKEALRTYLPKTTTFYPIIGNHDVTGTAGNTAQNLKIFNQAFNLPLNSPGYRLIEKEGKAYVILNSYAPSEENKIGTTQITWLQNTLNSIASTKNIYVFFHHPMYSAGYHKSLENRDEIHTILKNYNVKAVFTGHEHLYYKEIHDGISYFVTGGAGSTVHQTSSGNSVQHMLGVITSPNLQVDILDKNGEVIVP